MSEAAEMHSIENGVDPRTLSMIAFGGAGPVHAHGVAKKLRINKILFPFGAGVASAIGLLMAPTSIDLAFSFTLQIDDWKTAEIESLMRKAFGRARSMLRATPETEVNIMYSVDIRHKGQGHELTIQLPELSLPNDVFRALLLKNFNSRYEALYGHHILGEHIEAITWRARFEIPANASLRSSTILKVDKSNNGARRGTRAAYFEEMGGFIETPVYNHYALKPGDEIDGPAIIEQRESTAVIGPKWKARVDSFMNLIAVSDANYHDMDVGVEEQ
jgi:N-methylhydantoinase A